MDAYSTHHAAELAGITYRQADYWARIGIARPSLGEAAGSGSRRAYSRGDVRLLAVIGALAYLEFPVGRLDLAWLAELPDHEWTGTLIVTPAGYAYRADGDLLEAGDIVGAAVNLAVVALRLDLALTGHPAPAF